MKQGEMNEESVPASHLQLHLAILRELDSSLPGGARVLDFGCGEGKMVATYRAAGFDAYGCDLSPRLGADFIRPVGTVPYRIPFPDDHFDFVYSDQVFEHVQNLDQVASEIWRVLKPGAIGLHIFPARLKPIESHTLVPFAGVVQSYPWLLLWALLGRRNSFQQGKRARAAAHLNYSYLREKTNYRGKAQLERLVASPRGELAFIEGLVLKHGYGRARRLYPLARRVGIVARLYSSFYSRVLLMRRYR
jgi:SAM-dependent methyltransferase